MPRRVKPRNVATVASLLVILGGMTVLVSNSVTLYRLFCQATGFGGTPRFSAVRSGTMVDRRVTVRFNTDVDPKLPWRFEPVQRSVDLRLGEPALAYFRADNLAARPVTGTATFNVVPDKAAQYFVKTDCFCFTEQRLGPGRSASLPVSFFVDPEMAKDRGVDDITTITLSYTFFETKDAGAPGPVTALDRTTTAPN